MLCCRRSQTFFFTGAGPTIIRGLAINIGMLATYDPIKDYGASVLGDTMVNKALAGVLSGVCASTVSLPFDFIKTRLQKMKPNPDGTLPYRSFMHCVSTVAAKEGLLAFYSGYLTFVVRITPHIGLVPYTTR